MGTIRVVIFLLGLLVMGGALLFAIIPMPADPPRFGWSWWFALGLLLAVGSHGFPDALR